MIFFLILCSLKISCNRCWLALREFEVMKWSEIFVRPHTLNLLSHFVNSFCLKYIKNICKWRCINVRHHRRNDGIYENWNLPDLVMFNIIHNHVGCWRWLHLWRHQTRIERFAYPLHMSCDNRSLLLLICFLLQIELEYKLPPRHTLVLLLNKAFQLFSHS